jgi:dipeptidyl aminopeptidase/acylaminoacyl peptidase
MTFADMMAMKRVSDPQVSPSGKWVLFSVTDVSLEKNTKVNHLWVVALNATAGPSTAAGAGAPASAQDDKQKEKQVTFGDGESFGRFSPDGRWVSMTIGGQIYVAGWDEFHGTVGAPVLMKGTEIAGGADGAVWSPDSKRLMFVADLWPECSVKGGGGTPTHRDETAMNGAPNSSGGTTANAGILRSAQNDNPGGVVVGGTRDVSAWKTAEPATWAEENACDETRDKAADASAVKGQVWEGLLYRHWDQYTGQKRSHVLVRDVEGTHVRDLTPANVVGDAETPTWTLEGAQDYAWAPDSKEIAYVTNLDPVPAASTNNDVFTLRLDEAGAKAVKVSTSPGSDDEPEYSPDGKWLSFRSQARAGFESDRFRLMLFDREKKTTREQLPKLDRWVDEFIWKSDSKGIYFVAGDEGSETIFESSNANGLIPISLSMDVNPTAPDAEYSDLHIDGNGNKLIAMKMKVDHPGEVVRFDLDKPITAWAGLPPPPSISLKMSAFDLLKEHFAVISQQQITRINDPLVNRLDLAKLESFWFAGAEGTKVEGLLIKPPGFDAAKKYPVKFLMHGGPQTAWGDAWSYRWNWELMAASGYVVVGINRRGSTGYGQKFVDEVSGDWGGRAYEDLMKGLDYAEAKYPFLDKTRECALGASYGGYMADWVLTHTNRFKCVVTHDGMYDPVSAYGTTEELWFNEWEFRRPEDFPKGWDGFTPQRAKLAGDPGFSAAYNPMGGGKGGGGKKYGDSSPSAQNDSGQGAQNDKSKGNPEGHAAEPWRYQNLPADEDPFRRWSPLRFIENAKTPTLVIHSQKDYRLDVSQGFELYTALQRRGVPSKFLYFPDEGHWVLKPQNAELWNAVVSDWCDRWTKSGKYAEGQ